MHLCLFYHEKLLLFTLVFCYQYNNIKPCIILHIFWSFVLKSVCCWLHGEKSAYFSLFSSFISFWGTNLRESLNIQKRDCPSCGPSPRNSWPRPLLHRPQRTFRARGDSACFTRLSGCRVSVKAGQGEECSNFFLLENSLWPHSLHT